MNMTPKQAPAAFLNKVKERMETENIGVTELARKIGVSHPTIVEFLTYGKKPSFDTAVALANWLREPPVQVLRDAGLLPQEADSDPWVEEMAHKLTLLPGSLRSVTARFIDSMLEGEDAENKKSRKTRNSHNATAA